MKFSQKNIENWRFWKTQLFESTILNFFCFIAMKISHKVFVRMDGTQFSLLWCFTAKNERGNDKIAWMYSQKQFCGLNDRGYRSQPSHISFHFFIRIKKMTKNVVKVKGPILSDVKQKPSSCMEENRKYFFCHMYLT